jgi:hypothetical protein
MEGGTHIRSRKLPDFLYNLENNERLFCACMIEGEITNAKNGNHK